MLDFISIIITQLSHTHTHTSQSHSQSHSVSVTAAVNLNIDQPRELHLRFYTGFSSQ